MMELPNGVDPQNIPLKLAAQLLGRRSLDKLAKRLPVHTRGPAGHGVTRFTTWAAIQALDTPQHYPSSPRQVNPFRAANAVKLMRRTLA